LGIAIPVAAQDIATGQDQTPRTNVPAEAPQPPAAEKPEEKTSPLTIEGAINVPTAYFFRGYNIVDSGFMIQPELTISYTALEKGDFSITPWVGVWNEITGDPLGDGGWRNWNEVDVLAGVETDWKQWKLDVQYSLYAYPSNFADQTQEIGVTLSYDDSEKKFLPISIAPHLGWFWELQDLSDQSRDQYLEFGIEPPIYQKDKLTVSVPTIVGMSPDSYYVKSDGQNAFWGYGSVGIKGVYQITEHWNIHAEADYLYLFADNLQATNGDSDYAVIGSIGVGFSY
jgi:hypothetical protein